MQFLMLALASLTILLCGCRPSTFSTTNPIRKSILSSEEAIEVAIPALLSAYPQASKDPGFYRSNLSDGIWTISPRLPEGTVGGGPTADVDDSKRTVVRTYFTE